MRQEAGGLDEPAGGAALRERVSPEMLYLETKFASLVSYGLTVGLLGELLPLERPIGAERVRAASLPGR